MAATHATFPHELPGALAARLGRPMTARERCLPVHAVVADLLPEGGLVRGRSVGCSGPAAWSLAFALVAEAVVAGSWIAAVAVPGLGVEAAGGIGVPLGRVVVVDVDGGPAVWAERVAAAADGFEVVLTVPPAGAERVARRVRQRVQSNGVVLVAVDPGGPSLGCDLDLTTREAQWHGVGQGHGHLMARRVVLDVGGRRAPRPVRRELWLPGPDGTVAAVESVEAAEAAPGTSVLPFERAG